MKEYNMNITVDDDKQKVEFDFPFWMRVRLAYSIVHYGFFNLIGKTIVNIGVKKK